MRFIHTNTNLTRRFSWNEVHLLSLNLNAETRGQWILAPVHPPQRIGLITEIFMPTQTVIFRFAFRYAAVILMHRFCTNHTIFGQSTHKQYTN